MSISGANQLVYTRPAAAAAATATIRVTDSANATASIVIDIGEVTASYITVTDKGDSLTFTVTDTSMLGPTDLILVARYDGDGRMAWVKSYTKAELAAGSTLSVSKDGTAQVKASLLSYDSYTPICSPAQWLTD